MDRRANTEAFDKVRKSSLFLIMTLLCYFLSSGHHCKGHIDVVRILLAGKALLDTVDKKVRIIVFRKVFSVFVHCIATIIM